MAESDINNMIKTIETQIRRIDDYSIRRIYLSAIFTFSTFAGYYHLRLTEPATSITDFLLAIEVFFLSALLFRASGDQKSIQLWATGFLSLGVAALSGSLFH